MTNAEKILSAVDAKLNRSVELTIYGRAALALGFENSPPEYAKSDDVDVVFSIGQAEELHERTNFWDALSEVNAELEKQSQYVSHLFLESQVILTSQWKEQRVRIERDWRNLVVYRLGDKDLFLSKLMRDDPQDSTDAKFIAANADWSDAEIEAIIATARVPSVREVREQFAAAATHFISSRREMKERVLLESNAIAAIAYDREWRTLDVEFRGGGTYRYLDVPQSIYRDLLKAESAGAFWNEVKEDFAYIRLD